MLSSRLAKLCGALVSGIEAKREAAQGQTAKLIIRSASTWFRLIHLPLALQDTSLRRNLCAPG